MDCLLVRFQNYLKANDLADKEQKILLAVSGGVDSMAMLSLFARSGYDIGIAHCNFQLRGEESEEDSVMVEEVAAEMRIPYHGVRFDTAGEMERTGESVQIAARRLRYEWFEAIRREHGYHTIAIAHHADDSIETFFINMFRGTGLRGLTGINIVNGRIIRPIMFATRKDILDYAHANKLPYREDSSNRSTKYLRNKIRLGLVPRLKEISPRFPEVMSANIKRLTESQRFISAAIGKLRELVEEHRGSTVVIDPTKIDADFPQDFVIYELMNPYGFKGDVVDALCASLRNGQSGKRFYSRQYVAYIDRGNIIIEEIAEDDICEIAVERTQVKAYCGNSVLWFEYLDIDNVESLTQPDHIALLDADRLEFPLRLRRWRDGDSMIPLGMHGHKKISDILVDGKVSVPDKRRQFVLQSGNDIVWAVGRRIDDRYKITPGTENVLRIIKEQL